MRLPILQPLVRTLDTRIAQPEPKRADRELLSKAWRDMRDRVRREARGRCQAPGCKHHGVYVDHIVERKDGGSLLDRSNLQLLCASCHATKTNAQRGERMRR